MTGKLQKSAENMVRPVTPPPGVSWKKIPGTASLSFAAAAVDGTQRDKEAFSDHKVKGAHKVHYGDVFDDESVPALLDKLQYNLGSQLDDIMDHLDHLEDRIDDLEDLEREKVNNEEGGSQQGTPQQPRISVIARRSHAGSAAPLKEEDQEVREIVRRVEINSNEASPISAGGRSPLSGGEQGTPRQMVRRASRAAGSMRMIKREASKFGFRSLQSKRNINESPHEY